MIDFSPEERGERGKALQAEIDEEFHTLKNTKKYAASLLSRLRGMSPCKKCNGRGAIGNIKHYAHDNPLVIMCVECRGTGVSEMGKEF